MKSRKEGFMLPIESTCWREHLKQRIKLEASIVRVLIQWGMVESAPDVCRSVEEHFNARLDANLDASLMKLARPSEQDRAFVRDLLREVYLRTREIPRQGLTQARLHDGLLTGFEEMSLSILQSYERFMSWTESCAQVGRAA
jgi:hypothetical protein